MTERTRPGGAVERKLAMIKVRGKGESRTEALRLAEGFRARVGDATTESFIFELTGATKKIDDFVELMRPIGWSKSPARVLRRARAGRWGLRLSRGGQMAETKKMTLAEALAQPGSDCDFTPPRLKIRCRYMLDELSAETKDAVPDVDSEQHYWL